MKEDFLGKENIGFTSVKTSEVPAGKKSPIIWNTAKIDKVLEDYANGEIDIKGMKGTPFYNNDTQLRKKGVRYEYTKEELAELKRCEQDPLYFAEKYAYAMTEDGLTLLKYRDYQKEIIHAFNEHQFNILMASRQIGKTITSATYIVWYILFNKEKNVLIVGDVSDTTKELMQKIKDIINNLPFFMKPGMDVNNVMTMKFENGCRIIGRTTTKKTGIGMNIHLLYMDEFAHIDESYLNFFYRSIYPTISGMKNSKIIITSTPNGTNRFYKIWVGALEGTNGYHALRVDWWQVPGRDEAWKEETIGNLGSVEDFNQEYGIQFFSGDALLLNSVDLKKINSMQNRYEMFNTPVLEYERGDLSKYLKFNKKFIKERLMDTGDLRDDDDFYILSIDSGDGVGQNYSVMNIFKLVHLPLEMLKRNRTLVKTEHDIFGLLQVGSFRTNTINATTFADVVKDLVFRFFYSENVRIVIELNHKGEMIYQRLKTHGDFWDGMIVFSKHKVSDKHYSPGIILNSQKAKDDNCVTLRHLIAIDRILPNEYDTVEELSGFGKTKAGGSYRAQSGQDDLAITVVNSSAFFDSPQFFELCDEAYDMIEDDDYLDAIDIDFINYNSERDNADRGFDTASLNSLNSMMN